MDSKFDRVCRACMIETNSLIPIWSTENDAQISDDISSISKMLSVFSTLTPRIDDDLPKSLCMTCLGEMNHAFAFQQKCQRSEATLLRLVNTKKAIDQKTQSIQIEVAETSVEHTQIIFQCVDCTKEFDSNEEIEKHLLSCVVEGEEEAKDDPDVDQTMNEEDQTLSQLLVEEEKFEKTAPSGTFRCSHCSATFAKRLSLVFHRNSKRCLNGSVQCENCQRFFATPEKLKCHIQQQHDASGASQKTENVNENRKYKCETCEKSFSMLSTLKSHMRLHSGEKPFVCTICGKGFSQSPNLNQHLMRHNQNKPFKCDECPSKFVTKNELSTHLRKHTGEHPFVCEICKSTFTTSSSLKKHKRIHTGERPYACDQCPLRFSTLTVLKNHSRTHTGERPYKCEVCGRAFAQRSDCVVHARKHTGEMKFECRLCCKKFQQASSLRLHMKKLHAENTEKTK